MLLKETVGLHCANYTELIMVPYWPLANVTAGADPLGFQIYIYIYNARLHTNATAFTVNREYGVRKWKEIQ